MKQHRQRNGQEGIAMIIVVCIMAVLVMMSLALLLASSVMTQNAGRVKDQEQSRILAVSLADELEKELTVTPSQQEKTRASGTILEFVNSKIISGSWPSGEEQTFSLDSSALNQANELSNHDHSRFLTRTNSTVGRIATKGAKAANENVEKCILREAVVMQMTWPGAPTVYYGDEAGMVGWTDPDNRRSYPWGKQDWELIEFHKDMIRIHKKYECFRSGSYKSIASGSHWICYGRFNKKLQAVILINNRRETLTVDLPIWQIGILENACLKRVIQTTQSTYNVGEVMERAEDGILHVTVGPQTASVYIAAKNVEEN